MKKSITLLSFLFCFQAIADIPQGINIRRELKTIKSTPSLTAGVYKSGDVVALMHLPNAVRTRGWSGTIKNIVIIDKDDQGIEMDVHCYDSAPASEPAKRATLNVTDADQELFIGSVAAISSYEDFVVNKTATKGSIDLNFDAASDSTDIYCIAVTQGTPTYTASGLVFKFMIEQD